MHIKRIINKAEYINDINEIDVNAASVFIAVGICFCFSERTVSKTVWAY